MLIRKRLRRATGILLVVAGGLLMWFAPGPTFGSFPVTGLGLLLAGILLEIIGIFLEHRDANRRH